MHASLVFKILKSAFFAISINPMQTDAVVISALKMSFANGEHLLIIGIFLCMMASLIVNYLFGVGFRLLIVLFRPKIFNFLRFLRNRGKNANSNTIANISGDQYNEIGGKKYTEASRIFTFLCIPFVALFSIVGGIIPAMIVMLCGIMRTNFWVTMACCFVGCFGVMASFILL